MIKNKKAEQEEGPVPNVLGLILGVLIIIIILGGGSRLYAHYSADSESENAQKILNSLEGKLKILPTLEPPRTEFIFTAIDTGTVWYLVGFNTDNPSRPDKCFFKNCVCACKVVDFQPDCQNSGFCREFDQNITLFTHLQTTQDGKVSSELFNHIAISSKGISKIDLEYIKEKNEFVVYTNTSVVLTSVDIDIKR